MKEGSIDPKARLPTMLIVLPALGAAVVLANLLMTPWRSFGQAPASNQAGAAAAVSAMDSFVGGQPASRLLSVPVGNLYPGRAPLLPQVVNPVANDPQAAQRGQQYFNQFNCVGCHAPNGAGGMGPSLSNDVWIYGASPANIYLTIFQGRPKGMPAWGAMLPDSVIWDLVTYVKSISKPPETEWGKTTAADGFTVEQVPAENLQAVDPWAHVEKFSYGSAPAQHGEPAPPAGNGQ